MDWIGAKRSARAATAASSSPSIVSKTEAPASSLEAAADAPAWDPVVARRARRKADGSVLALLLLGLLVFQFDRMNLASALTDHFAADIGVKQGTINLGNQLMFLGIVILEIPSNLLLLRLGPRTWLACQILVFGFVATMQLFVRNRRGFLASRMILGLAEAGYIPGASYTLSTWYTRPELARRIGVFFFGMFGGNAISPILASGILKLDNKRGMHGWQWLFLIEGCFTMLVAVLVFFLLPGSPAAPRPLIGPGLVRFSPEEQATLQARLAADGAANHPDDVAPPDAATGGRVHVDAALVWRTVLHYRRWPHYLSTFAVFSTWSPLTTYTPTAIMALGFDRIAANALASVGAFIALPVVLAFSYLSDRTNKRGAAVIAAHLFYLIAAVLTRSIYPHVAGRWSRWGLWTLINSFAVGYHPNHNAWVQLNCQSPGERSIAVAMWVMSAILGLMVGTQYFQAGDAPSYQTGLRTIIIMISVGMFFALVQEAIYFVHNCRVDQGKHDRPDGKPPQKYVL